MSPSILDRLEALEKAATPGPWRFHPGGGHAHNSIRGAESVQTNGWREDRGGVSNRSYSDIVCENLGDAELDGPKANAALIIAARNALPGLLAALRAAVELRCCANPDSMRIVDALAAFDRALAEMEKGAPDA